MERDWRPIADAPRDCTMIEVLVPRAEGGFIEGRGYFDPVAYGGTWWWEGTALANYTDSSIDEGNHGPPAVWRELEAYSAGAEYLARRFYYERPAGGGGAHLSWEEAQREAAPYVDDLRRFAQMAINLTASVKAAA